ncbi:hypothetical protein OS242_10035 [Tumebacillus sp. DT12]|uniref:DUF3828 domain-containing protein n=1 Tax=Tumebacillus lacus TaxID=2995335 RepID=A0ABT3X071_9BACL|nr:hypothetical protein [Tumebacillus lacus]MCX7570302.1 hypothetical protein [Tumebacillus lacus]
MKRGLARLAGLLFVCFLSGCSVGEEREKEQAEQTAIDFSRKVLTMKDRETDTDIGGMEHATPEVQEILKERFGNLDRLRESVKGGQRLPEVTDVKIFETQQVRDNESGYLVNVQIEYNPVREVYVSRLGLKVIKVQDVWLIDDIRFGEFMKVTQK